MTYDNSDMNKSQVVYRSRYFLPTLKEDPGEAQTASHRLMIRAGMIRQSVAGVFSWLPMGLRVLKKIESIVRSEMNRAGGQEILMPTIQNADLWRQSGRYDSYGKEMLRISDRHGRDLLYGPTNEEVITEIFASSCKHEQDVPLLLYHNQWKFRDEIRPRFGVMRGREFYMKDAYSFDRDKKSALISYRKMFLAYLRAFAQMRLRPIPMRAETGPIGGDHSHEFVVLAKTGESQIYCHADILNLNPLAPGISYDDDLEPLFTTWSSIYAATEDEHDAVLFEKNIPKSQQVTARGIEVGHIFYFGEKYAKSFGAKLTNLPGHVHMGSYGIGISRLVGAIIEVNHDKNGILWPSSVAPFNVGMVNLAPDNPDCQNLEDQTRDHLVRAGFEIIIDDRNVRAGVKFSEMDLIGIPYRVVIAPRHAKSGTVEIKRRGTDQIDLVTPEAVVLAVTDNDA